MYVNSIRMIMKNRDQEDTDKTQIDSEGSVMN